METLTQLKTEVEQLEETELTFISSSHSEALAWGVRYMEVLVEK